MILQLFLLIEQCNQVPMLAIAWHGFSVSSVLYLVLYYPFFEANIVETSDETIVFYTGRPRVLAL